jgi:TnpA family transposase
LEKGVEAFFVADRTFEPVCDVRTAGRAVATYSRKNKLYFAFRELGRVVRTIFLLLYVSDLELRQVIQAATNKSEAFNKFVQLVCFGGEGVITD